jgi:hypothetical protein
MSATLVRIPFQNYVHRDFHDRRERSIMHEVLNNPFLFVLGILVITVGVPVGGAYWCKYRKNELDAALKHDMLQRGMTAEEINLVLQAPRGKGALPPQRPREVFERVRTRD